MTNFDNFFKSAFTVDNVIFGFDEGDLKVLLIKRGEEPYKGKWALPGYFVYSDEDLESAAGRVLKELTGLSASNHTYNTLPFASSPGSGTGIPQSKSRVMARGCSPPSSQERH